MIAFTERVHVEAVAGPDIAKRRHTQGFCADKIVVGRKLHVGGLARENGDAVAGPFGERSIVGKVLATGRCGTLVGLNDEIKGEGLRCLHQPQAAAIKRLGYSFPFIDLLDRVGDGTAGTAARCSAAASIARGSARQSGMAAPRRG